MTVHRDPAAPFSLTAHWPAIMAAAMALLAFGRADSAITESDNRLTKIESTDARQDSTQTQIIDRLARIEGKLDVIIMAGGLDRN